MNWRKSGTMLECEGLLNYVMQFKYFIKYELVCYEHIVMLGIYKTVFMLPSTLEIMYETATAHF